MTASCTDPKPDNSMLLPRCTTHHAGLRAAPVSHGAVCAVPLLVTFAALIAHCSPSTWIAISIGSKPSAAVTPSPCLTSLSSSCHCCYCCCRTIHTTTPGATLSSRCWVATHGTCHDALCIVVGTHATHPVCHHAAIARSLLCQPQRRLPVCLIGDGSHRAACHALVQRIWIEALAHKAHPSVLCRDGHIRCHDAPTAPTSTNVATAAFNPGTCCRCSTTISVVWRLC